MATKQPREVAGLGRPETPVETQARVAKSRAERRARQTFPNLVWSMAASLGVVALLIFVVVRPDDNLVPSVDWIDVATSASAQLPGEPIAPTLREGWSANRAEVSDEPGTSAVWSIGLLSPDAAFVFLDQGFDADARWIAERTRAGQVTADVALDGPEGSSILWSEYDRRDVDPGSIYSYVLVTTLEGFTLVVGGTSGAAVLEVARAAGDFVSRGAARG